MYSLVLQKLKFGDLNTHRHRHACMYLVEIGEFLRQIAKLKTSQKFPAIRYTATREKVKLLHNNY